MDAPSFNRELDRTLSEEGIVDAQLLADLRNSFTNGSASSVGWVEAKLRVLRDRIGRGQRLTVHEPLGTDSFEIATPRVFEAWVGRFFPGLEQEA
jgi:hypothetical protein